MLHDVPIQSLAVIGPLVEPDTQGRSEFVTGQLKNRHGHCCTILLFFHENVPTAPCILPPIYIHLFEIIKNS
jgi:hypothetical protein